MKKAFCILAAGLGFVLSAHSTPVVTTDLTQNNWSFNLIIDLAGRDPSISHTSFFIDGLLWYSQNGYATPNYVGIVDNGQWFSTVGTHTDSITYTLGGVDYSVDGTGYTLSQPTGPQPAIDVPDYTPGISIVLLFPLLIHRVKGCCQLKSTKL